MSDSLLGEPPDEMLTERTTLESKTKAFFAGEGAGMINKISFQGCVNMKCYACVCSGGLEGSVLGGRLTAVAFQ